MRVCKYCSKNEITVKFNGKSGKQCAECSKKRCTERRLFIKVSILLHYSNNHIKCSCDGCDEKRIEFLTVDHISGGGHEHRKHIKIPFYEWLWRNEFPTGFRVLCFNCNCSIGSFGYCPHNEESKIPSIEQLKHIKILPSRKDGVAWNSKLSPRIVEQVAIDRKNGASINQLARINGVTAPAIRSALNRIQKAI